ncbi:hypothetical protein VTK26DRAFT_6838 [Humicola hyalothermophila]
MQKQRLEAWPSLNRVACGAGELAERACLSFPQYQCQAPWQPASDWSGAAAHVDGRWSEFPLCVGLSLALQDRGVVRSLSKIPLSFRPYTSGLRYTSDRRNRHSCQWVNELLAASEHRWHVKQAYVRRTCGAVQIPRACDSFPALRFDPSQAIRNPFIIHASGGLSRSSRTSRLFFWSPS